MNKPKNAGMFCVERDGDFFYADEVINFGKDYCKGKRIRFHGNSTVLYNKDSILWSAPVIQEEQ